MTAAVLATAAFASLLLPFYIRARRARARRERLAERRAYQRPIEGLRARIRFVERLRYTERARARRAEAAEAAAIADRDAARDIAAGHLRAWRALSAEHERLILHGIEAQLRELEAGR